MDPPYLLEALSATSHCPLHRCRADLDSLQLPPSRLGQFLNLIGSGVYHSSVSLDPPLPISPSDLDPSPQEYAFGGHDTPRVSGVFSIPAGSAAQRMPGLRFYTTVDLGEAFGDDWEREFGTRSDPLSRVSTASGDKGKGRAADEDETIAGPPHGGWMSFSRSTTALASEADERNPFRDLVGEESIEDDDGGVRDGTEYLTRKQRRAWRIIEEMKNDEEWNGTRYRLLERWVSSPSSFSRTPRLTPTLAGTAITSHTSLSTISPVGRRRAG